MKQELTFHQRCRLTETMKLKGLIDKAEYLGDGLFHAIGYETEFDVSMSEQETDYVLNGLHLTRGE